MVDERPRGTPQDVPNFAARAGARAARKLKARRDAAHGIWFGLGTMGMVGWSVAVPTLLGAALGLWLDGRHAGNRSWTLALLVAGLVLGCANAWHWVVKEHRAMQDDEGTDHG
jgi:ATP synthase protein I